MEGSDRGYQPGIVILIAVRLSSGRRRTARIARDAAATSGAATRYRRFTMARAAPVRSGSTSAITSMGLSDDRPLASQGATVARGEFRSRRTFPLLSSVSIRSSASFTTNHTGVETGRPSLRKVVRERYFDVSVHVGSVTTDGMAGTVVVAGLRVPATDR